MCSSDLPAAPNLSKPSEPGKISFALRNPRLVGLGYKLAAFVRHIEAVDQIEERISLDSDKELQEQGYERKRRLAFPDGSVGDVSVKHCRYSGAGTSPGDLREASTT